MPCFLLPWVLFLTLLSSVFASSSVGIDHASSLGHNATRPVPSPPRGPIVLDVGSLTVTARPTGLKVGSTTVTPGGHITVGRETIALNTNGQAIVLDGKTIPFETKSQSLPLPRSTTTGRPSTRSRKPFSTSASVSHSLGGTISSHTPSRALTKLSGSSTTANSSTRARTTPSPSLAGVGGNPPSDTASTWDSTTLSDTSIPEGSTAVGSTTKKHTSTAPRANPRPSQSGGANYTRHATPARGSTTDDLPRKTKGDTSTDTATTPGPSHAGSGGATVAPATSTTSPRDWTTISDESTTGIYGFTILSDYKSLTAPTIITTGYVESASKTTTGPIFVGTGGVVLRPWPPPKGNKPGGGGGGGLHIPDPIRPSNSKSKPKCPAIIKWLCGPKHTSPNNDGGDVDPNAKPNSNPDDDPDKKEEKPTSDPTSDATSESTSDSSGTSTSETSTPSASTKSTASTTASSSKKCGSGTASPCLTFSTGPVWIYPAKTVDTAAVDKIASSIMAEDATIWAGFSSLLTQTGSDTTFSTAYSRSITGPAASTTPSKTRTSSVARTSSSSLSCYHRYDSRQDQDSCECERHEGRREVMSSSSGMTSYQPCAWTTLPPLFTDNNVGPITSTLSAGDIVYCKSAHWDSQGTSKKYCIGTMSTISAAPPTTTTDEVSPTGTGNPTGEIYIGIMSGVGIYGWAIYIPKPGQIPNWCDDSIGTKPGSWDMSKKSLPPSFKFKDLHGKANKKPCTYTAEKGKVGTLNCDGVGEVPCTGDFEHQKDERTCHNDGEAPGSAWPRVYCKWYGGEGI